MINEAVAAGARKQEACKLVGISIRTLQGWASGPKADQRHLRSTPPSNGFSASERATLLATVNAPEFRNLSPKQIVPALAESGIYVGSESAMYRILRAENMMAHRSATRPPTSRAPKRRDTTGRNQVWSWDITYLRRRDEPGRYYYLYLFVDVWSRYVVGWSIEESESEHLAAALLKRIAERLEIDPAGIVLHSDNGHPMRGASMVAMLTFLGMIPSLSRPRVSNDNPFSESLNKTLKYRPGYPAGGFADRAAAYAWVEAFVHWYNEKHRHSEIRFVTPSERYSGREHEVLRRRAITLESARLKHPERWTRGQIRDCTPVRIVTMHPGVRAYAAPSEAKK